MTERVDEPEIPVRGAAGDPLPRRPVPRESGHRAADSPTPPAGVTPPGGTPVAPAPPAGVRPVPPTTSPMAPGAVVRRPPRRPAGGQPPAGSRGTAPPRGPGRTAVPGTGGSPGTSRQRGRGRGVVVADDIQTPEPGALELSIGIPAFLRRGWERRRAEWTRVDTLVAGLIGVHLLTLVVLLPQGSLYLDDLRAQGYAQGQPFWSFIVGSNGTHFAPVPRILDWTMSRTLPVEHWPAVLLTLMVRFLLAAAFWRLLRRVFGPRPAAVIPLVVLMVTPALLPTTAWFRQSITVLACTVAMVWAVDAHIRWVTKRRGPDLATVIAATAIGLGCYEKPAALPGILAVTSVALFWSRKRSRPRDAIRASVQSVLGSAAVVVVFLVIYRFGPYDQGPGSPPSPLDVLSLAWSTLTEAMFPLLLGGPWTWVYTTPYEGSPHVATWGQIASGVAVVLLLLWGARRGIGGVVRGLLVALAWIAPSVTIITYGRGGDFRDVLADAVRLWADLVPGLLFAAALMVLPWRLGVRAPAPARREAAEAAEGDVVAGDPTGDPAGGEPDDTGPTRREGYLNVRLSPKVVAGGLVLAFVVGGSFVSSWRWIEEWRKNPTDAWLANVRVSLANAEAFPRVLATPLPPAVLPEWVSAKFPTSAPLILLMRPDVRFHDADGQTRLLDTGGNLVPVKSPNILTASKPAVFCAAQIPGASEQGARVPFTRPAVYVPGGQVEIGLLLEEQTSVEVQVEKPDGSLVSPERWSDDVMPKGPHTVRFPMPWGETITAVHVRTSNGVVSCVTRAQVWVEAP